MIIRAMMGKFSLKYLVIVVIALPKLITQNTEYNRLYRHTIIFGFIDLNKIIFKTRRYYPIFH